MKGLMQDWPLLVHTIIDHAAQYHGDREIVTRSIEGPIRRTTYMDVHKRARKVANALKHLGIGKGDPVVLLMPVSIDFWLATHALFALGAIAVPLNPGASPVELKSTGERCQIKAVIARPAIAFPRLQRDQGEQPVLRRAGAGNSLFQIVIARGNQQIKRIRRRHGVFQLGASRHRRLQEGRPGTCSWCQAGL